MTAQENFHSAAFVDRLEKMSDDELFEMMQRVEVESEELRPDERDGSDVFSKIGLVETAIEERFPGQLLAHYKDW